MYDSIPSRDAFVAAKTSLCLERAIDIRLRAGVELCLHQLTDMGVRSAFVSNADRIVVDANLRAAGVLKPGVVSVSRNDVRRGKPAPEPFLRAAHLLGAPPEECIVIEDSRLGVTAGLAARMHVIAWPQSAANAEEFSSRAILLRDHNLWQRLSRLCGHDEAIASSVSSPPEEQ
jgi:HAD superfamily hydrolase (TIGR01509 family)